MRKISLFATGAVAALILAGVSGWTVSTTQAVVPAAKATQIDPIQMMTSAKDLPTQKYEDLTFVF
jgi:hypothetical protein